MLVPLASVFVVIIVLWRLKIVKRMFKAGSPLFKVGYELHTKTRVGNFLHGRDLAKTRLQYPEGHTIVETTNFNGVSIVPIPFLKDNFAYLVIDKAAQISVVIDPADAQAVQTCIEKHNVRLSAIFTTHRHWDHSGGNRQLKSLYPNVAVYGSSIDKIPGLTHDIKDGETIQVGNIKITAIFTPAHTVGHTVYLLDGSESNSVNSLFTGDLLFLAGSGRMFEGPASQMLSSFDKICQLSDDTLIWPGHDYAKDDLEFARHIEPENEEVTTKLTWVEERKKENKMTSPSTMGEEKSYNPFLRTACSSILKLVNADSESETNRANVRAKALIFLRKSKDHFFYKL